MATVAGDMRCEMTPPAATLLLLVKICCANTTNPRMLCCSSLELTRGSFNGLNGFGVFPDKPGNVAVVGFLLSATLTVKICEPLSAIIATSPLPIRFGSFHPPIKEVLKS